jgi:NAD(P)-dependent dehydrogenase (short-subunit alcohol dehydrogenase family)
MTMTNTRKLLLVGAATVAAGASLAKLRRSHRGVSFNGRIVVITGGSRGLGLTLARRFRAEGARLALLAPNKDELRRAQAELGGSPNVVAIVCNVAERSQVAHAVELTLQQFGRIDVLINNAGVTQVGPIEQMSTKDLQQAMGAHFWGALHCIQAVIPHMRRRRLGRIVNIASSSGLFAVPDLVPYSASRSALIGLSDSVRAEVAKDGISVTTVSPGRSIDPNRAAKKILNAARLGLPHLTITSRPWRLARFVTALSNRAVVRSYELPLR